MATDTVTNNSDDATVQGSLPYELAQAQSGDTINFASDYTIDLNSTLQISKNVTIDATSSGGITLDGQNKIPDVFIESSNVSLNDLTIQDGHATGYLGGGAITIDSYYKPAHLSIRNTAIRNNVAIGRNSLGVIPGSGYGGGSTPDAAGGIYVGQYATLSIGLNNAFSGNSATGGAGGPGNGSGPKGQTSAVPKYAGGQGGAGGYAGNGIVRAPQAGQPGAGKFGGSGGAAATPTTYAGRGGFGTSYIGTSGGTYYGAGGGGGGGYAFQDYGGQGAINVVCFAAGTRIRIALGDAIVDVAAERLAVGDLAVTASGETRPIRWLSHRTIDCRKHPRPHEAHPVRIAAHAFGPTQPARDLYVSPGHALCLDVAGEVLIPASALVNGTTVVQLDVETVTYWHVELGTHDVILAENLPAESYLEMGNRAFFAEAQAVELHARPDAAVATLASFCRPYVDRGPRLEAIRSRLISQAGRLKQEQGEAIQRRRDRC